MLPVMKRSHEAKSGENIWKKHYMLAYYVRAEKRQARPAENRRLGHDRLAAC